MLGLPSVILGALRPFLVPILIGLAVIGGLLYLRSVWTTDAVQKVQIEQQSQLQKAEENGEKAASGAAATDVSSRLRNHDF